MPTGTRPFRQFVIKVHSRCDLACDHCYVYRHADQSWRGRPVTMSDATFTLAVERIAAHARTHALAKVHVVFHGGEPLLAGPRRLRAFARELRGSLGPVELDLHVQTNGLRLDDDFCAMLAEERIITGISLDGDRLSNDRHRIRSDGSGSYDDVVRAVRCIGKADHRAAFGGLLCTVDVVNDPVAVYRALAALEPPAIDFLLPHATWDRPPARPHGGTDYADWLIAVHQQWTADGRPFRIRMFESVSRLAKGGVSLIEALGLGSSDLLVVETDGAIEQADWLKTVAEGAADTGFHVATDSFDRAAAHPGVRAQRQGMNGLSDQCRACPVMEVCGGGLYAHRYRTPSGAEDGGFDNPSVYCADLLKLIQHVQQADETAPSHRLSPDHFDQLAAGFGAVEAVRDLESVELDLRRTLLKAAHRAEPRPAGAWDALLGLSRTALGAALREPYLRAWALDVHESTVPDPARPAEVALAAVARTGGSLTLSVPLRDGSLHLPGLGRLIVGEAAVRAVTVSAAQGHVRFDGREVEALPSGVRWRPLRHLSTDGFRVALDDLDPYRDQWRTPALHRLTATEFRRWQEAFHAAWQILRLDLPRQAEGLAAGLRTITPVAASGPVGADRGRGVFGAVGVALPATPEALALLLVRAFQEAKLDLLMVMYDLLGHRADRHPVSWSAVPERLDAILRETYARLAVVDFWRTRARRAADAKGRAEAVRRGKAASEGVPGALDTLREHAAPTAVGRRLLAGMASTEGVFDGAL
ncbi:FxsB family cyclophane-forming radical SAM/SPASM peptide maturase [Streptomyces sp. NPDC008141]|uniref:FxsB family cyclophane-forming radical SAM/SPASM peptide maturase n=1 Tax=Streptomyces sp. NPDC008141 TaxID=3364815 RepID=UPI0036E06E8E